MNSTKITPRQRIISALNHKETDRVPVDLGATDSSGIMAIAYNKLRNCLGFKGTSYVWDLMQVISKVEIPVVNATGSDAIPLLLEPKKWKPYKLDDGTDIQIPFKADLRKTASGETVLLSKDGTILSRCPKDGYYFDPVFFPLKDATSKRDIDLKTHFISSFDWPEYLDEDFDDLAVKAQKLYNETGYAIVANLSIHIFAAGQWLRGFDNFMMDLVTNKPMAHYLLSVLTDVYIKRIDRYLDAVGNYSQVILVNDDLGTQRGLQISPELYREMIKPYHMKVWQFIKDKSKKPLLLHSCGSIYKLIPDLIEAGIDAINPVQVTAEGMDTKKLKKEFGKDITFWGGGCDTQSILARGTPDDVRKEVRQRVQDLSSGGGFVFCQVHNIQADVPVKNILAMYDELGTLN
jgi:uroporphyrinogen decarboxylase